LITIGVAALGVLWLTAATPGAGQSASVEVVAIDADPSGNGPRSVGTIENCLSAAAGESVVIDIVVPDPGVPADRGMAAYQFSIMYDPAVVWIGADDSDMLLAQAAGSNVIPIADPKPDRNGVYQSWGVDFGPSGIEPIGSSEKGPGVIARITLLPQSEGISTLTLSNVLVIDDASERISLGSILSATIHVGEPCAGQSPKTTPSPDNDDSSDGGDSGTSGDNGDSDIAPAMSTPSPESPGAVPTGGGAPPATGGTSAWFVVAGLIAALGGASLLVVGKLAFSGRTRPTLPLGDVWPDGD